MHLDYNLQYLKSLNMNLSFSLLLRFSFEVKRNVAPQKTGTGLEHMKTKALIHNTLQSDPLKAWEQSESQKHSARTNR